MFTWSGGGTRLPELLLGIEGAHQIENAAVALAILDQLPPDLKCEPEILRASLAQVRVAGRLEWLAPDLLVDCAHNPDGCVALATYLQRRDRRGSRTLLLGASRNKALRQMGSVLAPQVDRIFTTACAHPRSLPPGEVAQALEGLDLPVMPAGRVEDALQMARSQGGEVIVAGSVFLAGAVRDLVGRL
jgi:dihydrofolate synthase/folylpolyglutamate synthase